MNSRLSNNTSN